MSCLEPDKNSSKEARQILISLGKLKLANKLQLGKDTGFVFSPVARKLRELIGKRGG